MIHATQAKTLSKKSLIYLNNKGASVSLVSPLGSQYKELMLMFYEEHTIEEVFTYRELKNEYFDFGEELMSPLSSKLSLQNENTMKRRFAIGRKVFSI